MDCKEWLAKRLSKMTFCEVNETRSAAKEAGYSKVKLKEARKELGVKTYHRFVAGTDVKLHFWYLPGDGVRRF